MLPLIALDRVNVHLGQRHVLHDIDFTLLPGDHWAVVGPNGSGKSTLLRVLAGTQWIDPDAGTRRYSPDGVRSDVVARATTWIRSVSAEQHERYARLDLGLTGRTLVASGIDDTVYVHRPPAPADDARIDALLDEFDLHAFAGRALRELSSGQLRRLLIARALVALPRVIVLDEFSNGLDRNARRDVAALLDRLAPRVALVIASHRSHDFPAAVTRTATLRDGRLVAPVASRRPEPRPARRPAAATGGEVLVRFAGADVYRGRTLVLRDVNWELRRGEHTLVRGANGAGKSTFAGLIAGTIPAATGARIERFGERGPFDVWRLKERIAHLSDDLQIAYDQSETVEAVIASGFPASIGLFTEPTAAQRHTVGELIERIGLERLRGRTYTGLSFGERRKVLVARSLVRRPEIFILDEIWNGLDADFRHMLAGLLDELAQAGTTLVAIAHDEDDEIGERIGRVCRIENGTVRAVAGVTPA